MSDFYKHIIETLSGNGALTLVLIFFNEILMPKKNVSGEWYVDLTYEITPYKKYEGIQIQYKFNLLQQGAQISGYGEKISDIDDVRGKFEFDRDKRVQVEIKGYYERNFLKRSKLYLSLFVKGRTRETSESFLLCFESSTILQGRFLSTAADSSGPITMIKNELVL